MNLLSTLNAFLEGIFKATLTAIWPTTRAQRETATRLQWADAVRRCLERSAPHGDIQYLTVDANDTIANLFNNLKNDISTATIGEMAEVLKVCADRELAYASELFLMQPQEIVSVRIKDLPGAWPSDVNAHRIQAECANEVASSIFSHLNSAGHALLKIWGAAVALLFFVLAVPFLKAIWESGNGDSLDAALRLALSDSLSRWAMLEGKHHWVSGWYSTLMTVSFGVIVCSAAFGATIAAISIQSRTKRTASRCEAQAMDSDGASMAVSK